MNETETNKIREKPLGLKTDLQDLQESSAGASKTVELDQASVGRLSRMHAMQAQTMAKETAAASAGAAKN